MQQITKDGVMLVGEAAKQFITYKYVELFSTLIFFGLVVCGLFYGLYKVMKDF